MIWSREFVSGANDWCCGLQEAIVVTVYLSGYLCWPHTNSPTSSWAGGASSPQYTAAYQPDAASTHSPPPPLFPPFFPSPSPLCFPPYVQRQINNSLHSTLSFPLICLSLSACLSTCCSSCSGQTRLGYPPISHSQGAWE